MILQDSLNTFISGFSALEKGDIERHIEEAEKKKARDDAIRSTAQSSKKIAASVSDLQKQVADLQNELSGLSSKLTNANLRIDELTKDLENARQKAADDAEKLKLENQRFSAIIAVLGAVLSVALSALIVVLY